MGYQTNYNLKVTPESDEVWSAIEENEEISYAVGEYKDSCKWYEHDSDMINFSKQFPDALFTLNGEGEEAGDIWITYYKNGKMQQCPAKITYDEFDESKLK
jgi:hypothetical protein